MAPFPHPLTVAFAVIAAIGTLASLYALLWPRSDAMTKRDTKVAQTIIGHDVQNHGPGVGQEIVNTGGGTGGEVSVTAPSGVSVIGTRMIQSGSGIGMRVINSGPGTGFKSTVVIGPKE
jgi:hypothetical protein